MTEPQLDQYVKDHPFISIHMYQALRASGVERSQQNETTMQTWLSLLDRQRQDKPSTHARKSGLHKVWTAGALVMIDLPQSTEQEIHIDNLLDELEDAAWCSRGEESTTQKEAAQERAVKARAAIHELLTRARLQVIIPDNPPRGTADKLEDDDFLMDEELV